MYGSCPSRTVLRDTSSNFSDLQHYQHYVHAYSNRWKYHYKQYLCRGS